MSSTSITADDASWLDLFRGANALRVLVLAAGVALHAINLYLTTTILPSVVDDIGGVAFYAWNTTLFIVASITGAAVAAQVIQHLGRAAPTCWAPWCSAAARRCARWRPPCRCCWSAVCYRGWAVAYCCRRRMC